MVAILFTNIFSLFSSYSLASTAGLLSERSGTVNIALEGKMIFGGLIWALLMATPGFTASMGMAAPFVAMLFAGIGALIYSFILSFFTINLMADHVIVGTAMNMLAPAVSLLIIFVLTGATTISLPPEGTLSMGWAGDIDTTAIIYLMISVSIMIGTWFFLSKTKWGLRLKTAGENPYSLASAGVSVATTKYSANAAAGLLAGFAGAMAMLTMYGGVFGGAVNGMGYIAIAILILGRWNVMGIGIGTIIISISMAFARTWGSFGTDFPQEIIQMIPFILPLIAMAGMKVFWDDKGHGAYGGAPKAAGIPFKKDQR